MPSLRKAQIPDPRPVREISKPDQTPTSPQLSKTPEQVIVLLGPVKEAGKRRPFYPFGNKDKPVFARSIKQDKVEWDDL